MTISVLKHVIVSINVPRNRRGYRANFNARRLATGSAETVAYIMPAHTGGSLNRSLRNFLKVSDNPYQKEGGTVGCVQAQSSEAEEEAIRKPPAAGGSVAWHCRVPTSKIDALNCWNS